MADPLSSLPPQADDPGAAGGDARIEQLLVTGLDHYFAGEFEAAIDLWTRVLFLDRNHDRARAYIERARSAQAERQRQTEALVHQGLDAFDRGEVEQARALLSDALDRGASHDLALGVLGRIERLELGARGATSKRAGRHRTPTASGAAVPVPRRSAGHSMGFWLLNLAAVVILGLSSWWLWTTNGWPDLWPSPAAGGRMAAIPEVTGPLPVPSAAEAYLRRGQALFDSGRLRDALVVLDRVPAGDPLRADADQMRARIQRELLALALALAETGIGTPGRAPESPRPPE